jgi:enoyl-CoA hydratase/carnithine racemase
LIDLSPYRGKTLSWEISGGIVELTLHRAPANEIGTEMLEELEKFTKLVEQECGPRPMAAVRSEEDLERFAAALECPGGPLSALIIHSSLKSGFSAGADLRELYARAQSLDAAARVTGMREFLWRVHRVLATLDSTPMVTIAAVHGICFGGGFEIALACDLIVADKMARFCFPELRLGLIPGFGGIPRLKRDLGNAVVRDLLLTGRSINAAKAQSVGLVSQVAAEGEALRVARSTAQQITKFDRETRIAAKKFIKPIPHDEFRREIDIFCELFGKPAAMQSLKKFVESKDAMPYLP